MTDLSYIVNGGYSIWSEFTDCSKSCGGGVKSRARTCTNPAPDDKGKDCSLLGASSETISCNNEPCPTTMPTTEPTAEPTTIEPTKEPATTEPTTEQITSPSGTNTSQSEQPPTTEEKPKTSTNQRLDKETKPISTSEQSPTTISTPKTSEEPPKTPSN